ncbi:MAG: hotdog fold thioesterase [Syntrophales bacterium]|nr:hotdog fold thioesterase [Syntrophales bacterium]
MKAYSLDENLVKGLLERFSKDYFAHYVGIEIEEMAPGRAKTRLKIQDRHRNGVGMIHGGVIFTLADLAFAAASNSHGPVAVALNASIMFLRSSRGNTLYAEAEECSRTKRVGTYSIRVYDDLGETIALFTGQAYVKSEL